MIFEGSCDTGDWSNGAEKLSFVIIGTASVLKLKQIENSYFKL